MSKKKFRRISEKITLTMALWLILITALATGASYLHITSIVTALMTESLQKSISIRGDRESDEFKQIEKNQHVLAERLARHLKSPEARTYHGQFEKVFSVFPDGAIRDKTEISNVEHPGFFIPKTLRLTPSLEKTAVLLYEFLDRDCFLALASLSDCWVADATGMYGVFDGKEKSYAVQTGADFDNLRESWMTSILPENDRDRAARWTRAYLDPNIKIWMITLSTPVYIGDQFVGAVGNDLFLSDFFNRTSEFKLEGTKTFIINKDGDLVMHPDLQDEILKAPTPLKVSDRPELARVYSLAQQHVAYENGELRGGAVYDLDSENLVAITKIEGPDWYLATLYPKSLIAAAAFKASRYILLFGCIGLLIEVLLFMRLIQEKLARPLGELVTVVEKVGTGDLQAKVYTQTQDEFELLGDAFNEMTHNLGLSRAESQAALAKALEASRVKSDFLATMSHEMRTPLNGIIGMTQILQDSKLDDQQSRQAALIADSGNHLLHLVNQILDTAKLDGKKFELSEVSFSLKALLEEVESTYSFTTRQKGLGLDFAKALEGDHFIGDANHLRQCLTELVENAIKFSNAGLISVRVQVVSNSATSSRLRFSVKDQGIGLSPEALPKLFTPFTQIDASMSRKYGGAGLGLYLCKSLIELMGGQLRVASELGTGSEFWFEIPLRIAEKPLVPSTSSKDENILERRPILVVEDNAINQVLTEAMLKKLGYSAVIAKDGQVAVDLFECGRFALILMDCQMPVMDGYEATRLIRAKEDGTSRVPIIALTANTDEKDRAECLASGMDEMLSKPVKFGGFKERVEHWLQAPNAVSKTG